MLVLVHPQKSPPVVHRTERITRTEIASHEHSAVTHLLLDAQAQQLTWGDGSRAEFTDREGTSADFPRDLKGISGCPVWRTVDLNVPIDDWHRLTPRVVGVQTGVYQQSQVIRVTRWAAVTTLIHAAFPELRPAIDLTS
jgi:hypothetical protein